MYLYKFFAADWKLFDAFRHEEGLATLQAEADSKWFGDLDKARFSMRLSVARSLANSLAILVQSSESSPDADQPFDVQRYLCEHFWDSKDRANNGLAARRQQSAAAAAAEADGGDGEEDVADIFGGPLNVADIIGASRAWGVFVPRHLCPGTVVSVFFPALAVNVTAVVEQLHCTRKFAYTLRIVQPAAYATVFEAVLDHARGLMWIKQAMQQVCARVCVCLCLCLAGCASCVCVCVHVCAHPEPLHVDRRPCSPFPLSFPSGVLLLVVVVRLCCVCPAHPSTLLWSMPSAVGAAKVRLAVGGQKTTTRARRRTSTAGRKRRRKVAGCRHGPGLSACCVPPHGKLIVSW